MAIDSGYVSLSELKAALTLPGTYTDEDTLLERIVEAASRQIDEDTGRRFYAATQTRYFTAEDPDVLDVDDLLSVSTLKTLTQNNAGTRTYGDSWAATDYDLEPYSAQQESTPRPYTRVRTNPLGRYTFPSARRGVEIAGSWGYASTAPKPIHQACLRLAGRLYGLRKAPLGIAQAGVSGEGQSGGTRLVPADGDYLRLIAPFRRHHVGGF